MTSSETRRGAETQRGSETKRDGVRTRVLQILPLLILAVSAFGFVSLGRKAPPETRETTGPSAALVETVAVEAAAEALPIQIDGIVAPHREVALAAEVTGRIRHVAPECQAGHFLAKGTLLLEIDPRDYELEIERLTAERNQAQASLAELDVDVENVRASIELAQRELQLQQQETRRTEELLGRQVATDAAMDTARRDELARQTNLLNLENQLRSRQAARPGLEHAVELVESRLATARLNLERTRVVAPFDGVVVSESVEAGGYVTAGTELLKLEDTAAAEIRCSLTMDDLGWIWSQRQTGSQAFQLGENYQIPPTPAEVRFQLGDLEYVWQGMLSRYDGWGLDERTRTVPCRVLVSRPTDYQVRSISPAQRETGRLVSRSSQGAGPPVLMRGMFVAVQLQAQSGVPLVKVPESAVRPGNLVWQVESGRLAIRPVVVARVTQNEVLLDAAASGLRPGDQVIVSPLATPREGMAVQPQVDDVSHVAESEQPAGPAANAAKAAVRPRRTI